MNDREHRSPVEDRLRENETDLLRYFQRRLENGSDAAEALGELMLTAWKLRRRIPGDPTEARMWLFATARNVLRDTRRTLARRSASAQRFVEGMRVDGAVWEDSSADLRDAIARLPEDDAELVRLVYWEGFASHEAAAILGINPSTARSRLSRARERLRESLLPPTNTPVTRRPGMEAASGSQKHRVWRQGAQHVRL